MRTRWMQTAGHGLVLSVFAVAITASPVMAGAIYTLSTEFSNSGSGDLDPTIAPTVAITDDGLGTVTITMTAQFDTTTPFISEIYMNFTPDGSVGLLDITQLSGPTATSIFTGVDAFKADGDGYFDILFLFETAQSPDRFDNNDVAIFTVACPGCGFLLSQGAFETASETTSGDPEQGNGVWHVAAHLQGLGAAGQDSGWYGDSNGNGGPPTQVDVPAPAGLLVLGAGLLVVAALGWPRA